MTDYLIIIQYGVYPLTVFFTSVITSWIVIGHDIRICQWLLTGIGLAGNGYIIYYDFSSNANLLIFNYYITLLDTFGVHTTPIMVFFFTSLVMLGYKKNILEYLNLPAQPVIVPLATSFFYDIQKNDVTGLEDDDVYIKF